MNLDESCVEVTVNTSPEIPKKDELVHNDDNDAGSSPRAASPEANCPICLGMPENKSFTDSCLHQFCFKCLLEWSKVKAECPLCKQSFKSIIHNVRSIEDYEQYYLSTTSTEGTLYVSREIFARLESAPPSSYHREPSNYRFRTTAVSSYLDYFVRLEEAISHRVIPPGPSISGGTLWQRRRQRGTSDFRRNIYQQGLWVQRTTDITGRVRECGPEFYRANPAQVHRLVPWLNRELNVLLYENSPHIQHVMSRILELITQVPIRSSGFRAVIAPYIGRHTEHFIHEFHNFATSPFDLVGYDRHANYVGRSEIVEHEETSQHSDSDSDVQILDEGAEPLSPLIHLVDTDSDDCIVLDAPTRPVPEVITIESDDDDVVQISIQTYQPQQSSSNEPPQSTSASTSQPKPSTSRRPRLKRNWITVNNVHVPTTSSTSENLNGCEISISIAHSSRSMSSSSSSDSSASWVPVRKKPTKVRRKKETARMGGGKTKVEVLRQTLKHARARQPKTNDATQKPKSEDDSSPGPGSRRRKPSVAIMSASYSSEDSDSDRTYKENGINKKPLRTVSGERKSSVLPSSSVDSDSDRLFVATDSDKTCRGNGINRKPLRPVSRERKPSVLRSSSVDSDSDRLFVATDSSSDDSKYKHRLRSVVVKSTVRSEPRAVSPAFSSSHSRSESHDYDYTPYSSRSYLDIPSSSRSRSNSYRSIYSHRSQRSSSSSTERPPNKRCKKHSKKLTKRDKF